MVIQATEGSMEIFPLLFGVKTVLWPMPAKKGGRWYRGVVEAVVCLMARWHRDEAESIWLYATQHRTPRVTTRESGAGAGGEQPY